MTWSQSTPSPKTTNKSSPGSTKPCSPAKKNCNNYYWNNSPVMRRRNLRQQMKIFQGILLVGLLLISHACSDEFLQLEPIGTQLETNFYQTEEELFEGLVATYDVIGWQGTGGWTMEMGLLNAASDDTYAGGSDASDQPSWVAYDQFSLTPFLGPQGGLWQKGFVGVYRANLLLQKLNDRRDDFDPLFVERTEAELHLLRAWFYFDLVRFFENVPLFTEPVRLSDIDNVRQVPAAETLAQIDADLQFALGSVGLPETVPPNELGRFTRDVARVMQAKSIFWQNDEARMGEAATLLDAVIGSGNYQLMENFGDIFLRENEWGPESVYEIQFSDNRPGDFGCCFISGPVQNATEGNYNVQFFGMRDYAGPTWAAGWSFCPVSFELADFMEGDPRFEHTIIDGNALRAQGATYTEGFQNTDFFIKKYHPVQDNIALDGTTFLAWGENIRAIRLADVLLLAAEAHNRNGDDATARQYLNRVRSRVGLQPFQGNVGGSALLDAIYRERRMELATEGHRFFDLLRTNRAAEVLEGFRAGTHERLPIPQQELDLAQGALVQNPGY